MDPTSFVNSAVLLLLVASVTIALFRRFGLGSILGLLVTGIIVGPHTPGPFITNEVDEVRRFTEIGVVLLLFLIGLEMKPRRLWELRRMLFGLGTLQIVVCAAAIGAYFRLIDPTGPVPLLIGATFALSSTAFVMQLLKEQGEIGSRHGQTAFAILLMQDLAVVPLLAMVPIFADRGAVPKDTSLGQQIAIALLMIGLVMAAGRFLVPRILDHLARTKNREAFLLSAMAAMFVAAMAMEHAGMSMALGAFVMGMMLSTSRYALQIEASMEPHKGLLMSLFFVAVGMSVDVAALAERPIEFLSHVMAIVLIKVLAIYLLCLLFRTGRATALRTAFLLAQGGEFGFVLFGAAKVIGVVDDRHFVLVVAVISVTMLLTPLLARIGNRLAQRQADSSGTRPDDGPTLDGGNDPEPRVIIGGYGRVGHTVGTILGSNRIPFVAFDTNAALVAQWQKEGHPVFFGEIGDPALFATAALQHVELLV
ncbi:MAG TPA: cation:proton antiporter, partial [Accumulibacter sp.]|nr:cation:proton antiporter [Accumulibacter sp.]